MVLFASFVISVSNEISVSSVRGEKIVLKPNFKRLDSVAKQIFQRL